MKVNSTIVSMRNVWTGIAVAAMLWFVMFSPWTAPHVNFWWAMTGSGVVLTTLAILLARPLSAVFV